MDCNYDPSLPKRGAVVEHTPTENEWDRLEAIFADNQSWLRAVRRLRSNGNTPVEICRDPDFDEENVRPMNERLEALESQFRLVPTYPGTWDEIMFRRVSMLRPVLESPPCS